MPDNPIENPIGELHQLLEWRTRGENCVICDSLRGRIYTYDTWMSAGVWPGFHANCDCYLKKVGEIGGVLPEVSDLDFFGTDLNLLARTINPNIGWLKFHLDPSYKPYSWYMTEQITEAHITYGADRPIGEVLKLMRNDWQGFFKRSTFYDNFFVWRVFKTMQHYQPKDDWMGKNIIERAGFEMPAMWQPRTLTGSTVSRRNQFDFFFLSSLSPDSLKPYYPYQTYSRGAPYAYPH